MSYLLLSVGGILFLATINWKTEQLDAFDVQNGSPSDAPWWREGSSRIGESRSPPINIWHSGTDRYSDRILAQMAHVPTDYTPSSPMKYIFVPGGIWDTPMGQSKFVEQRCRVDRCALTIHQPTRADAVLVQNSKDAAWMKKQPGQIWILWLLESPMNSIGLTWLQDNINWTASYRADSTIVTPYEKFVPHANVSRLPGQAMRNFADGKTKLVAWFVSNCNAGNRRLEYARELRRYVSVDIYGSCGDHRCARGSHGKRCDTLLRKDYKFYLSFENSNCEYYITEKLFWNALL